MKLGEMYLAVPAKQATAESAAKLQPMHGISVGGGWFSYIGCMCVCARACASEHASARASERASEHEGARLSFSSALFLIQFFHRHVTRSNKCLSLYRTRALSHTHAHMHAQILDPTRQAAVARTTTTRTQWKRRGTTGLPLCQQWHQLHRPLSTR